MFRYKDKTFEVNLYEHKLIPGDIIMLITDGIHDNLSDPKMQQLLDTNYNKTAPEIASVILENAQSAMKNGDIYQRSKPDDATVIVYKHQPPRLTSSGGWMSLGSWW